MNLKKIVSIVLIFTLSFVSFVGCSKGNDTDNNSTKKVKVKSLKSAKVGEYVKIGTYEIDGNTDNGKEDLVWLVLSEENGNKLLITKDVIAQKEYKDEWVNTTWSDSLLRLWMNNSFYEGAFNEKEKSKIQSTKLVNKDNENSGILGGEDTEDKIFALSIEEANKYFESDEARKATATTYANNSGITIDEELSTSTYWLRTPGKYQHYASRVYFDGKVNSFGMYVYSNKDGARPAMWVKAK